MNTRRMIVAHRVKLFFFLQNPLYLLQFPAPALGGRLSVQCTRVWLYVYVCAFLDIISQAAGGGYAEINQKEYTVRYCYSVLMLHFRSPHCGATGYVCLSVWLSRYNFMNDFLLHHPVFKQKQIVPIYQKKECQISATKNNIRNN